MHLCTKKLPNMHLKYQATKHAKICKVKIVLFDSIEHESNLYPDPQ
jgi:hypothetical protein